MGHRAAYAAKNIISLVKRICPEDFKTPFELSSRFGLGIAICI
jgi:hypothetical protein